MGKEFTIIKELSTISATLAELVAIDRILLAEITSADFRRDYVSLLSDIHNTYQAFIDILQPLTQALTLESFNANFNEIHQYYGDNHQSMHSQSRVNAEFTYEKYLQFRKLKQVNTAYPPLKAAFARLHDLIDKWIDNDIWLALCIDTVLKMLNQILSDVAKLRINDEDEAYRYYYSCVNEFVPYLSMMTERLDLLSVNSKEN